jgi:hypothetical protein
MAMFFTQFPHYKEFVFACVRPKTNADKKSKPMVHAQALRFHICLYRKLIGESCSAFCTSSLQNFATVGGTHSFSEAVFFLSLKLLGLVCSKHCFRTSLK